MKKINLVGWVLLVISILFILFLTNKLRESNQTLELTQNLYSDSLYTFKYKLNKTQDIVYEQSQVIATQKQAIRAGLLDKQELEKNNIKKAQTILRLRNQIGIYHDSLKYISDPIVITDTIVLNDSTYYMDYLQVPVSFQKQDDWSNIQGTVTKSGVLIDSLEIELDTDITIGLQSQGFLKKAKPVVIVDYSNNPYVDLQSLENIVIQDSRKFYDKTWFKLTAGAILGITFYGIVLD